MAFRKAKNKYASEDFNLPDSMGGAGDMSMGDPSMDMGDPMMGGMDMGKRGMAGSCSTKPSSKSLL